jgi:hypothetical protein
MIKAASMTHLGTVIAYHLLKDESGIHRLG